MLLVNFLHGQLTH